MTSSLLDNVRLCDPSGETRTLADVEREIIAKAVARHRGKKTEAARALGIGRSTLYRHCLEEEAAADEV